MVSAMCSGCSRVSRGKMVVRAKPSKMPGTRVRGALELLCDDCKSRENWDGRWLASRTEMVQVKEVIAGPVLNCSGPVSERPSCSTWSQRAAQTRVFPEV